MKRGSMTGEFAKELSSLERIFAFLGEFVEEEGLGEEAEFCIDLVAEELFTNAVKYGSAASDRVRMDIERVGPQLRLELVDFDAEPFDPTSVRPVPPETPMEARRPGGLGLHLVRSLVDRVDYEYRNRELRIVVTKQLGR
ncbi:MAG: ATP-binding protein [Acidobacteriota bacterium]